MTQPIGTIDLKPCPFCGSAAERDPEYLPWVGCLNKDCPIYGNEWIEEEIWNRRTPAPVESVPAPAGLDLEAAAERLLDHWARWSIQIGPDAPTGFLHAIDYLRMALSKEVPKGAEPSDLLIHSIAKSAYLEGARDFYSGEEHNRERDIEEWWLNSDAIRRNPDPTRRFRHG